MRINTKNHFFKVPRNTQIEEFNANPKRACDNGKMFVRCSNDKEKKKLCCPFCLKRFAKLARHLATVHKKEQDVKKFVNLPKGKLYIYITFTTFEQETISKGLLISKLGCEYIENNKNKSN